VDRGPGGLVAPRSVAPGPVYRVPSAMPGSPGGAGPVW